MNKSTFEKSLVENLGYDKKGAHKVASVIIDSFIDGIVNEDKVTLIGMGTIDKIVRQARKGRNPKTGEVLDVPEKVAIRFKPGKELKEAINGADVAIDLDAEVEESTNEDLQDEDLQDELEEILEEA